MGARLLRRQEHVRLRPDSGREGVRRQWNQLGDQTVSLAANQTWANTSDGLFGASTFSSLPLVPIVRLQFTARPDRGPGPPEERTDVCLDTAQPTYEQ